jgi:hypothetical protein
MGREPPITFSAALKILGHYERPLVDRLDRLLGGAILGAGIALVAGPVVSALTAVWGSVDQKNEAFGLLRQGLDRIESRMYALRGYERVELVATAHTILCLLWRPTTIVPATSGRSRSSNGLRQRRTGR